MTNQIRLRILPLAMGLALIGRLSFASEEPRLMRAKTCMDLMLYDEAISLFDQVLAEHPRERGLRVRQAYAYLRLGEHKKAMEVLNKEHETSPADLQPLILLSFIQYTAGQRDDAERTSRSVQETLDRIHETSGRKQAETILRSLSPNTGLPAYILGLRAKDKRDAPAARSLFSLALALGYDQTDCWVQAIDAEIEAMNWAEGLELCDPRGGKRLLGQEAQGAPLVSASVISTSKQKGIFSDVPADILALKAIICAQLGRRDESQACLEAAVSVEPFRPDLLKNLAMDDLRRGDFERASRLLGRVLKLTPLDFQARFLVEQAQAHRRTADHSIASDFSRDFLKARDPRFHYVMEGRPIEVIAAAYRYALDFVQRGLLSDAARHLRMFTEIYEDSPTIFYDLGQIDCALGLFAEALVCGAKALKLKEDYLEAHDLMGNVYFRVGDFEHAAISYERAVRLNSHDPLGFFNLGCALHELGNDHNAEINWLEAVRLENIAAAAAPLTHEDPYALEHSLVVDVEPISALAYQYLGFLCKARKEPARAIEYFEKAIAFNPKSPILHLEIGRLYLDRNEPSKAERHFLAYLELGGDEREIKGLRK